MLKNLPLFSTMDAQEIAGVEAIMARKTYLAGHIIVRQEEAGDHFHVVVSGLVKSTITDSDGNEIIIDEVGPGGYFGELSMLTGESGCESVQAVEDVETLELNRHEFQAFLRATPDAALDVITAIGKRLHHLEHIPRRKASRNANEVDAQDLTFGERVADRFAAVMGSWPFIMIQSTFLVIWVTLNCIAWSHGWDPYPFILLNLALSFQAAYSAPIIMMSQNRQSDKDRVASEIDHQVNVKGELEAAIIIRRLGEIEDALARRHDEQLSAIKQVAPP